MSRLRDLAALPGVWLGRDLAAVRTPSRATGFARLDRELPGGGWPTGTLTEILTEQSGIGEVALLMPALARLSREGRWLAWIAPPHLPYPPALIQAGIDLGRLIVVTPEAQREALWAVEQALRSTVCGAVLAWPHSLTRSSGAGKKTAAPKYPDLRRLQVAAEATETLAVLFRPAQAASEASPAALRVALAPHHDGRLAVHILKRRGVPAEAPVLLDIHSHAVDRGTPPAARARRTPPRSELVN